MGLRGKQTEPTELKKLKGTLVKSRVPENELVFQCMTHIPEAPDTFNETSIQLWVSCCVSLQGVGLLFPQDLPLLEEYVYAVFMLRESRRQLMNADIVEEQTNKAGYTYQSINKWVKINLEYSKEATRLGREFGFSPSARTKISTTKPSDTYPLDDF